MNRIKIFITVMSVSTLLFATDVAGQKLPFGKKKNDQDTTQTDDEKGGGLSGFAGKMKSKAKNFNVMKSIGKLAGNIMTTSTADLSTLSMQVIYMQNLYPSETETIETEYFGFWTPGMDMTGVMFLKKEGVGMSKIDGSVKIDGSEIEHVANGFYGGLVDENSRSHTVDISTANGDVAKITAEPIEKIEIISVNGVPRGEVVAINMDEDLVLELNHPEGGTADFYVSILGKVMGIRGFNELGFFKSVDKITIPKEAFRHTGTPAYKFEQGANYILVQRTKETVVDLPNVGATQVISGAMDWSPITLTGDQKTFLGIGVDESNANFRVTTDDEFKVDVSKPNAFWGPPLSQPKKIAMASFVVRATGLDQKEVSTSSSSYTAGGYTTTTTTTTTTTSTFPKVPEAYWDQLVEEFYSKFEAALLSELGIEIMPIEQTMKAKEYGNLFSTPDTVSTEYVVKPYKDCKLLLPTTMGEIWSTRSSTFPNDNPQVKLLKELGVDGIISVTVDCSMDFDTQALSPRFSFKIDGPTNGWKVGPTNYASGLITGPGQGVDEAGKTASDVVDQLNKIMNVDRQIELFKIGISELKKSEQGKGYEKIWALK